jgi:hypothetical protein
MTGCAVTASASWSPAVNNDLYVILYFALARLGAISMPVNRTMR